jgi:regulator of nucleoside diphosphate kinase
MTTVNTTRPANPPIPRPRIVIAESDHARLTRLTEGSHRQSEVAEFLSEELTRAHIVADEDCAEDTVRMGSRVTYSDAASGRTRDITLVYPQEADIAQNRVSVLTPIGAALIGLSPSQSIYWPTPDGSNSTLTVLSVSNVG